MGQACRKGTLAMARAPSGGSSRGGEESGTPALQHSGGPVKRPGGCLRSFPAPAGLRGAAPGCILWRLCTFGGGCERAGEPGRPSASLMYSARAAQAVSFVVFPARSNSRAPALPVCSIPTLRPQLACLFIQTLLLAQPRLDRFSALWVAVINSFLRP